MTKAEIVQAIYARVGGFSKKESADIVDLVFEMMKETLAKSARGQRVYSRRDVENLLRVRELLYTQGFTIAGARKQLQKPGAPVSNATEAEDLATAHDGGAAPPISTAPPEPRDFGRDPNE